MAMDWLPLENEQGRKLLDSLGCHLRILEGSYAKAFSWPMAIPSPKSHGVLNTVPVGTCHFLLHTPLFLGMIQRGWVWGTDLGPNPICPLPCIENLGGLSNFIGSVFLSEKP